jgi:hypothetical protein
MANVTIDPEVLIRAMTAAIQAAIQQPTVETKSKRGRPAKTKQLPPTLKVVRDRKVIEVPTEELLPQNIEIIHVKEEDIVAANEELPVVKKPKDAFLFVAKKIINSCSKQVQAKEDVTVSRGEQRFIDVAGVPHEKQDWEPTERRQAAKMLDFVCTQCNRPFQDYPSNVQQAFFRIGGSDMPDNQDGCVVIKCPKCSTR